MKNIDWRIYSVIPTQQQTHVRSTNMQMRGLTWRSWKI